MSQKEQDQQAQQKQEQQAQSEFLQRAAKAQPPFKISKNELVEIAAACQERNFAEEIELIQDHGGDNWIEEGLCTNFKKGIPGTPEDMEKRNFAFQNNEKVEIELKGFFELICDALEDFTLRILVVCAIVSIIVEIIVNLGTDKVKTAWIEGTAILVAVVVVSLVTAVNDYQKERQFQELNNKADERKVVTVIRNGVNMTIHNTKVMVGDLIVLQEGMEIPADGYLFQSAELTTDESAMTGETDPIRKEVLENCVKKMKEIEFNCEKNECGKHGVPSNIIMSGTKILTGEGKMLVIVVGDSSCVGKISALLRQGDPDETPLQIKLTTLAEDIGRAGLYAAIVIIIVLFIRFAIERIVEKKFDSAKHIAEMVHFFILGITVVVVAVPEGLPLSVTLSLAYSVKKMLNDQNLVRKLQACETMGGANNICSDKTGTLTKNLMTLTTWWSEEYKQFDFQNKVLNFNDYMPQGFQQFFIENCALNSSAQLRPDEKGSKTEVAIIIALEKFGINYEDIRKQFNDETCRKIPFSSKRKRMSCILTYPNGKRRIYVKGASEMVLKSCNKYIKKSDLKEYPLTEEVKSTIQQNIKKMADNALRTICMAYKDLTGNEDVEHQDQFGVYPVENQDLVLMAVLGIADVIRPEVPHAVATCQKAGITVRMVTGDNIDTARAIARDCGILKPGDTKNLVMEGSEFIQKTGGVVCKKCRTLLCECPRDRDQAKKMKKPIRVDTIKNAEVFDDLQDKLVVMARSRPEDKYALVTGLIERDHVVAVTGDGTNDAPALKKADVGFAMGIAGTEVARQAADIILLDDNFKSIVAACMWGRNIYDCIKKFLQFQLTVNIVAVVITLIGSVIIKQEVVTPIQLLWVNLIMDTLASLALATEPPTEKLLDRLPHNRYEYIVSKKMVKHLLIQAIYQLIVLCIFVFGGENIIPEGTDKKFDEKIYNKFFTQIQTKYISNAKPIKELILSEHDWEAISRKDRLEIEPWHELMIHEDYREDPAQLFDHPCVKSYKSTQDFMETIKLIKSEFNLEEKEAIQLCELPFYPIRYKEKDLKKITIGREKTYNGVKDLYEIQYEMFDYFSRQFTFLFNIFVNMQIFNFINARKIYDEINSFEGIQNNGFFVGIVFFIAAAQAIIVSFGGIAFNCYAGGLNGPQWGICIAFAFIGNILNFLIKGIDEDKIIKFNLGWGDKAVKGAQDEEEEENFNNDDDKAPKDQQKETKNPKKDSNQVEAKQVSNDQINNLPNKKKLLPPINDKAHNQLHEQDQQNNSNQGPQE